MYTHIWDTYLSHRMCLVTTEFALLDLIVHGGE